MEKSPFLPSISTSTVTRLAAGLSLLALAGTAAAQTEWPMYQADAGHTGSLPIQFDPSSLAQRWRVRLGTNALHPVVVAEGSKVFVSSEEKKLWALEAATGRILWSVDLGRPSSVNPPSYWNGRVYIQTGNHSNDTWLRSYRADTGALVFASPHGAQWERYLAPTIRDGKVYVNGGVYGGMYAFDGTTGQQLWFNSALPQYDRWTPAVDEGAAYAYVGGYLYVVNRVTGTVSHSVRDINFSWAGWSMGLAPVLGGRQDLFVVATRRLVRFDLQSRSVSYEVGSFSGQPAVQDGVVYGIQDGHLVALDQVTGALRWTWQSPNASLVGTTVVTSKHALVHSATSVYVIDLETHAQVGSHPEGGELSLGAGAIYIAQPGGYLTSVGYAQLPAVLGLNPSRMRYGEPPVKVTVSGSGYGQGAVSVRFGGVEATDVVLVDDRTITCTPPALGPGVVDVFVENTTGRGSLPAGFAYTPALTVAGDLYPGGDAVVTYLCERGDAVVGILGAPPIRSIQTPYRGELCIAPFHLLVAAPAWPFDRFTIVLPIPNDSSLSGAQVLFQALVGRDLVPVPLGGAWTNCSSVRIR